MNASEKAEKAFGIINDKATSNAVVQGLGGIFGTYVSVAIDGAVIYYLYRPMINEIRNLYGRAPLCKQEIRPILKKMAGPLMFDLAVDKTLGMIPFFGILPNVLCAKAMTWRLGLVFTMLASHGGDLISDEKILEESVRLARYVFPMKQVLKMGQPDRDAFARIVLSVGETSSEVYEDKVMEALSLFSD